MQRSASQPQMYDEFCSMNTSPSKSQSHPKDAEATNQLELPTYNPLSHVARKEISRRRSAENAIHFIPLVLALSAVILWLFSNPEPRA